MKPKPSEATQIRRLKAQLKVAKAAIEYVAAQDARPYQLPVSPLEKVVRYTRATLNRIREMK